MVHDDLLTNTNRGNSRTASWMGCKISYCIQVISGGPHFVNACDSSQFYRIYNRDIFSKEANP